MEEGYFVVLKIMILLNKYYELSEPRKISF